MFKKITQTATGLNDLHATVSDAMREYEETQRQLGDKADSAADSFVGKAILGVVVAIMALAVIAVQFPSATQLFPPLFGAFFVLIGVGGFMSFRKKPKSARRWYEAAVLAFALVGGIVFCASIGLTAAGFDLDAAVNSLGSWESDGSYVNRPLCLVAGLFFASVGIVGAATIGNSPKRRRRDVEERLTLTVEGTVVEPPVIYVTVNGVRQPLRSADTCVEVEIDGATETLTIPNTVGTFRVGDAVVLHVNPEYHKDFLWEGLLYAPVDRRGQVGCIIAAAVGLFVMSLGLIP